MKESQPDAAPDHPDNTEVNCASCTNTVTLSEAIEHPAYRQVFCSRACLSRFLNHVQ